MPLRSVRHAQRVVRAAITTTMVLASGCSTPRASDLRELAPLRAGQAVDDGVVAQATLRVPDDGVWLALEQAYALLRHARSDDDVARARAHLERAFATFEDLRDPENLNVAFTEDARTPYRGRPHERVLATTTLALLDAASGRCDLALPTLRAAEFLDVRWQQLAFGTDAVLVYATALHCLAQTHGRPEDVRRADDGLRLTLRYNAAAEPLRALLHDALDVVPRHDAVAVRLAAEMIELGTLHALAADERARSTDEILRAGRDRTAIFAARLDELLVVPEIAAALDAARGAAGTTIGRDAADARAFVKNHLQPAIHDVIAVLERASSTRPARRAFDAALHEADEHHTRTRAILQGPRVELLLSGRGPAVVREGQYDEVARIAPRDGAPTTPALRHRALDNADTPCGVRGDDDNITVVLCAPGARPPAPTGDLDALEVWSSSTQATSVVGRRFDTILKGRAAFKAGTEAVATVAAESAFSLWRAGLQTLATCGSSSSSRSSSPSSSSPSSSSSRKTAARTRRGNAEARRGEAASSDNAFETCVAVASGELAVGGIIAGVGGVAWLAGAAVNPAADPRFVDGLPETVELVLPAAAPSPSSTAEPPTGAP